MTDRSAALAMREAIKKLIRDHQIVISNKTDPYLMLRREGSTEGLDWIGFIDELPLPEEPAGGADKEKPEPNPEWEAKANAYHAEKIAEYGVEPLQTLRMLERWTADAEPANEKGQVSFSRAMLESAADALRFLIAKDTSALPAPPSVDVMGLVEQFEKAAVDVGWEACAGSARIIDAEKHLPVTRDALVAAITNLQKTTRYEVTGGEK